MTSTVPCDLCGKTYSLLYNVAAMIQCVKRYGGISKMLERLGVTEVQDGVDEKGKPKFVRVVDEALFLPEIPWLFTIMANQGTILETGVTRPDNPALITEDYVQIHAMPADFQRMATAVMGAIAAGNSTEHETKNADPAI